MADAVEMRTEDFPCLPSGLAEVNKMIKEHGDLFSDSQCKVCSAVLISESQKLTHYQSKKHANKVRRYLSIQNEKEPELKKFKSPSSDSVDCNNGDSDRLKVCHVCNMTFSSPVVAESHYQGKVHAKNLRLKAVGPQTLVAQTAPTAQPKKKPVDDSSAAPEAGNNNNNNNDDNPDRFCSICQASFNNPLMAQQHYVGKKHRKQMTKLKLMETYGPSTAPASTLKGYPCTICNIELNSVEQYQSHISGAKHKNQVKKSALNPAENQHAADQSGGGENQSAVGGDQFADGGDQFADGGDRFADGGHQFAEGGHQFGSEDNQYGTGDEQYPAGDNTYAPEDTEYSEEYQYT